MKNARALLPWAIVVCCLAAVLCNALYLAGVLPKTAASVGALLLILCYAAVWIDRRRGGAASPSTRLGAARGVATAVLAVMWVVTYGMTFFWKIS